MKQTQPDYRLEDSYLFFPSKDDIVTANGLRRIFYNVEYDDNEKKKMQLFKEYCVKQKYDLGPFFNDAVVLRFLHANTFKNDKTLQTIKQHDEWRKEKLPMQVNANIESFFNAGILYIHGVDHRFRPIIVFNAYKIDIKKLDLDTMTDSLTYILEYVIHSLFLPGQIENWVFIMDLNGVGLSSLPLSAIKKLMGFLQVNFRGALYALYVVNTPSSIYLPWKMIKAFLEEQTVKKINFYDKSVPELLFTHSNREQVEVKFGGTARDRDIFWPPHFPSSNAFTAKDNASQFLLTKKIYAEKAQKGELKNYTLNKKFIVQESKQSSPDKTPNSLGADLEIPSSKQINDSRNGGSSVLSEPVESAISSKDSKRVAKSMPFMISTSKHKDLKKTATYSGNQSRLGRQPTYQGEADHCGIMEEEIMNKCLPYEYMIAEHYRYFHEKITANTSSITSPVSASGAPGHQRPVLPCRNTFKKSRFSQISLAESKIEVEDKSESASLNLDVFTPPHHKK
jgi:hypothetical protein